MLRFIKGVVFEHTNTSTLKDVSVSKASTASASPVFHDPSTELKNKFQLHLVDKFERIKKLREEFKQHIERLEEKLENKVEAPKCDTPETIGDKYFQIKSKEFKDLSVPLLSDLISSTEEDRATLVEDCKKAIKIINLIEFGMVEVQNFIKDNSSKFLLYDVLDYFISLARIRRCQSIPFSFTEPADTAFYMRFFDPVNNCPMNHFSYWLENQVWHDLHLIHYAVVGFFKKEESAISTTAFVAESLHITPDSLTTDKEKENPSMGAATSSTKSIHMVTTDLAVDLTKNPDPDMMRKTF